MAQAPTTLVLADLIDGDDSSAVPEPPAEDGGIADTQPDSTAVEIGTAVDVDGAASSTGKGVSEEIPGDGGHEWGAEVSLEETAWAHSSEAALEGAESLPETLHRVIHDVTVRFEGPIKNEHSGHVEHSMIAASNDCLGGFANHLPRPSSESVQA